MDVKLSFFQEDCNPINDLEIILRNVQTHSYIYINEIVRDLRYLIKHTKFYPDVRWKNGFIKNFLHHFFYSHFARLIQKRILLTVY